MQSQMINMQSTLDRILAAVQSGHQQHPTNGYQPHSPQYPPQPIPVSHPHAGYIGAAAPPRTSVDIFNPEPNNTPRSATGKSFPPLPGFAAPVSLFQPHLYVSYPAHECICGSPAS